MELASNKTLSHFPTPPAPREPLGLPKVKGFGGAYVIVYYFDVEYAIWGVRVRELTRRP